MALYMTIDNEYELQKIFEDWNRDYYSLDGYRVILDYYDEVDGELDVIAICGDFTEYESVDDLLYAYGKTDFETWLDDNGCIMYEELKADYFDDFVTEQLDYINYNHTCVELDNGNYMFME